MAMNQSRLERENLEAHVDLCAERYRVLEEKLNTKSYPIVEFSSDSIFNPPIYLTPANDKGLAVAPNHRTFINIDEAAQIINSYYNEI